MDPVHALGRHFGQLSRELFLRGIAQSLVVDERELLGLGASGLDQVTPPVTERQRHRSAAHRVEIPPAGRIDHEHAVTLDDHRIATVEFRRQHVRL